MITYHINIKFVTNLLKINIIIHFKFNNKINYIIILYFKNLYISLTLNINLNGIYIFF